MEKKETRIKSYRTHEERVSAFKQALQVREKWEEAIRKGMSQEEVKNMGIEIIKFK